MLVSLDATRILPNLFQGSMPPPGEAVRLSGFDLLVLCAQEYQPKADNFGVGVLHVPLNDSILTSQEWRSACIAAGTIVDYLRDDRKVLVTCQQGRNRSGLVVALVVNAVCRVSGPSIIDYIQRRRKNALTNESFCAAIRKLQGGRRMEDLPLRQAHPVQPRPM